MNKNLLLSGVALALVSTSQAGENYSAKSSKIVVPPPPAPECRLQWFTAVSAGYLTDAEEGIYHLQFGVEKLCPTHSHALYLEIGYTDSDESVTQITGEAAFQILSTDIEIVPITLNYKYEQSINQKLNWYAGVGVGIALVDVNLSITDDFFNNSGSTGDDDTVFYAQAFAGLTYNFSPSFEVFGGARYIYMDDPGFGPESDRASLDGDILLELGARYNF